MNAKRILVPTDLSGCSAESLEYAQSVRLDHIGPRERLRYQSLERTLAIGICGTDRKIIAGHYGETPPGETFMFWA